MSYIIQPNRAQSSKRPELSKSVSRDSHSSSRTHNGDSSDKHSHKDKHKSSKESSSKTPSAAKIGDRRRSSDANSSSSRDHHHHDRKSGKSRESSRDRSETPRRHSQDKKELHKHSSNSERKDSKHKDNKEKDRMRDKERERQKLKSRRESEDTKADAKESREKDRERFYEETKKKLADHRKKEKEEKEKEKKEKKKSSNPSSSGASAKPDESLKEQLSSLDMEDIKKLLLRVATDKAAPANIAEEINKLHHEKDAKKSSKAETKTSSKKENDSKRKLVVIDSSDDNSDDIEVLNDTSHKKRDNTSTEKSSKVENEKSTKKVTAKDLNKTASGQSKSKTQEPPAKRRKLNISDSESSDSSSDEEETQNINQKKSASRQNVRKSAKPVEESDSDSSDPDDYKPDKSLVGKVESPAKKMKTRGVKVNLNRLSQNELDYLCDKEGDESSDSDFEVTVDHVEPASSEVIKVPDLKPTVKSPTRPPSTPGHNKTKSSTVKSPTKLSSPASTKIKSPAQIPSQEKSTVDNVDGTPKVQKKKKVISSPDKNEAEKKCEEKPKERKRSTKEMEENITKTPKASNKSQVTKTPKSNKKIDTPKMVDTATNDNIVVENIDEIVGEPFFGFGEDCLEMVAQNRDNLAASFEDQNNIKIGEISEDRLAEFIPETKTITIDLPTDCDTTGLLANIDSSLGGGARTLAPIPQWLEPHIIGAKCKPEELEMPTEQEIADYLKKQQKKAKKRGCGYDIVVEWVPTKDPKQAKTKAERELRNDPYSTFFSGIEESGGKRTRRANNRYSSAEYSVGGLDTSGGNMETDAESSRPANNAEQIKIEDDIATQVDTPRVKSSKERINMYLRTAGIDRQLPDSTSNTLETTNNAGDAIKVEEIKVEVNNTKTNEEEPTSTANVDSTEMLTETPEKMTRTRKRSGAAVSTSEVGENAPAALIENAANTPGTRATRKARRKSTSVKKEDHETVKCDIKSEDLTSTVETSVDNAKNDVDVELEQTESEMEKVLDSLKKRKRNGSGPAPVSQQQLKQPMLLQTEEFYGWPCETVTPLTAVSTCNLEADVLDKQGNTFGLLDIDVISKDIFCKETYDSNLEVIMSPALQKDLRILQKEQSRLRQMQPHSSPTKISSNSTSTTTTGPLSVEVKESVLLRPVKSQLDLRNGSDGSDSDDKGSISPVSSEVESSVARPTRKSLTGSAGDVSSSETPSAARPTRKRRASAANQPQETITASASKRLRSK